MPGKPELQKLLWNWRQMFARHTRPVCVASQEPRHIWALFGKPARILADVSCLRKGKNESHTSQLNLQGGHNPRHKWWVLLKHLKRVSVHPSTPPASVIWWRCEGILSKISFLSLFCSNTSASLQIKRNKACFLPGMSSLKHSVCSRAKFSGIIFGLFSST